MKKVIIIIALVCTIICSFENVYATNIINETRNNLVNIYDEVTDMDNNTNGIMNNDDNDSVMENVVDGLSVGIIVASVVIIAGVIFYYLIPKK